MLGAALMLVACGEKPQQGTRTRGADAPAWQGSTQQAYNAPGWKAGDEAAWDTQMRQRARGQDEHVRIGLR